MGPLEQKAQAATKAARALDLKLHGHTWVQVAEIVGFSSPQVACRAVTRHLSSHPAEGVEELRQQEALKLDCLERECWTEYRRIRWATCARGLVEDSEGNPVPDTSHRDRIINTLIRIYARRSRLLGLDVQPAPQDAEEGTIDAEIESLVEDLVAGLQPRVPGHPG